MPRIQSLDKRVAAATPEDWDTEYLDAILSVRVVDGVGGAIEHIERHSSHHTEAIVTKNAATAARFLNEIDSGIVIWNSSTQFADGGEFGIGRRDRHLDRQAACAGAGGGRAADLL